MLVEENQKLRTNRKGSTRNDELNEVILMPIPTLRGIVTLCAVCAASMQLHKTTH